MTRKHLRGAIVERLEHPATKRQGVMRLDKRSMRFFARENDNDALAEPFSSKDGGEVRTWLLKQLAHTTADGRLDWIPVVEVEHGGDSKHYYSDTSKEERVSLEIKRYWLALTRDQREWRKLDWEECDPESSTAIPDNDRYAASRKYREGPKSDRLSSYDRPFRIPSFDSRSHGERVVVAYTEHLWAGLVHIVKQIKVMRKTLAELVGTKAGVKAVTEIGAGRAQLRLMAPKGEK